MTSSWTQPVCGKCWGSDGSEPIPGLGVQWEKCSGCGKLTKLGIYLRRDPDLVPFPRVWEGDGE